MRSTNILSAVLLLASSCVAWPTGWDLSLDMIKREIAPIHKQKRASSFDLSFTGIQGNTATTVSTTTQSSNSAATGSGTITGTNSNSKQTGTATTGSGSGSKKTDDNSTPTFDPQDPAGGLSMITPAVTAVASYYKIKDQVTFAWNYTSLSITPSYIDILASCASNKATYTIATNQSVTASTQAVTWDTGAYQATATLPLLTSTYTLIIYDAAKPVTAIPSPGYFAVFNQFTFGMYIPQPYTPLADFVCATCNAGVNAAQLQALWVVLGTAGITVLSAGWFAGVAGLW